MNYPQHFKLGNKTIGSMEEVVNPFNNFFVFVRPITLLRNLSTWRNITVV